MTAGLEYPQSKRRGNKKVASTETTHPGVTDDQSMVLFLHTFLRGHLRRSLQSGLFRTNTMAAATHIPFIHPTEDGGPDERTDERTAISESVHYCYCFARAPRRRGGAVPLADAGQGREKAAARRPFARSEQESSPMTKWKVRPSDRTKAATIESR